MIVSVHLAKTAGTSFGKSLEEHFGTTLQKDYGDFPLIKPAYDRNIITLQESIDNGSRDFNNINCIHGHFAPLKYLLLSTRIDIKYVTWLRDPVERLASHYWYWKKIYDPNSSRFLHKKMIEEDWSIERFCLGPELRNFYGQFLWGFPLEQFSFIGIVEHYKEDFSYFNQAFLGADLTAYEENITEKKGEKARYIDDSDFRTAIELHHSNDVELYQRALEMRLKIRGSCSL